MLKDYLPKTRETYTLTEIKTAFEKYIEETNKLKN